jgi:hypothetical protein
MSCAASSAQVLWFGDWKRPSMRDLPHMMLPHMLELAKDPNVMVTELVAIHESCKCRGATPQDYIAFLNSFQGLYNSQVRPPPPCVGIGC